MKKTKGALKDPAAEPSMNKRSITIPEEVIQKWQSIVNILTKLIHVPAALIMKIETPYIEVFRSSESRNNPYKVGDREHLASSGLYCEHVIKTKDKLLVPNALNDKHWNKNPDIKLGMISYLGYPLMWPNGEVFGTICVLDLKENSYSKVYEKLMLQFKELVEAHLGLLYESEHLKDLTGERTAKLKKVNEQLRQSITDHKLIEEALKRSEDSLAEAQRIAHIGSWDLDLITNTLTWSDEVYRIFGLEPQQFGATYEAFLDNIHPDDRKMVNKAYTESVKNKTPYDIVHRLLLKDGTIKYVNERCETFYSGDGKSIRSIGTVQDITERKRAEEKLKEYSQRLEEIVDKRTKELRDAQQELIRKEKLAVLGELGGGVAHELRNPLGAIKNASYFLTMVLENPEPEVKETLEILGQNVDTSERIISNLLDFARPKSPVRREVDINEIIQEAVSGTAVPENVEVETQLEKKLPTISADPEQIRIVSANIILNAIQAMSKGGRLVVETTVDDSMWMTVSFKDTGEGIPEENLGKLFEPLFTTKAKGIGLSLALSRTIVDQHGGTIEAESEVGQGSTFTVRLPVAAE